MIIRQTVGYVALKVYDGDLLGMGKSLKEKVGAPMDGKLSRILVPTGPTTTSRTVTLNFRSAAQSASAEPDKIARH